MAAITKFRTLAIVPVVACYERLSTLTLCLVMSFSTFALPATAVAQVETSTLREAPQISSGPEQTAEMFGGLMRLDVTVTDKGGNTVSGLTRSDFTLLDNGQPVDILSFSGFDELTVKPGPPVEAILLFDTLDLPANLISDERHAIEAFLRLDGGHLKVPTSVLELSTTGLWLVAQSSDGNAMASDIAHSTQIAQLRSFRSELRGDSSPSLNPDNPPSLEALKALGQIAAAERQKSGRKLLIWVGPGWGLGSGRYSDSRVSKDEVFYAIRWFSTLLREARIVLYTLSVGETDPALLYQDYLQGAQSAEHASFMNLYRKVLAIQSGGLVLNRSYDIVRQIEDCMRDANIFYTLSFNPRAAKHPGEYHDLTVRVDKPGLTARTTTGYYNQVFYSDFPDPILNPVTVEQLEQLLGAIHGESDAQVTHELSGLALTERLSSAKLSSWLSRVHGEKARQALVGLADVSTFLDPPAAEIAQDPTPNASEQQHIVTMAAEYVRNAIPQLPNFYAKRTTVRYEDAPQFHEGNTLMSYAQLHKAESSKETVLYRNGAELVDSGKRANPKGRQLSTYGTFGPVLRLVQGLFAIPGNLAWSRWEQDEYGRRAVFRYTVPLTKSVYEAFGCCLPGGNGTLAFNIVAGYHGEIAIDPTSGAIIRLEAKADLKGFVPLARSDITVEYGPVEIGGKTYFCPVKSVSLMRSRSVVLLKEWDESFRTYGPYATTMNDITFDNYHVFRAESSVLTDFKPVE
jgi:VWFA-related protein